MSSVGENIKKLRKQNELTQVEFAKQIGVSQGTLSDIEKGNCNPSVETLMSIHERYQVSFHWLLKGHEEQLIGNSEVINQLELELLEVIKSLSEREALGVLEFARTKLVVNNSNNGIDPRL